MQIEKESLIEHERKTMTWMQREEVNNLNLVRDEYTIYRLCILYACKSIKGKPVNEKTIEDILMDLSSIEINNLGTYIYLDINKLLQDKKKLSKPGSQSGECSEVDLPTEEK